MHNFDMVTARLVLALAREGSIGRAAERENIAPSAISRRIADLEARLGTQLFDRSPHGVRPTEAGNAYVAGCRAMMRAVDDLDSVMSDYAKGRRGNLRIACATSALSGRLPELIAAFSENNPQIRIELHEMAGIDSLVALEDARVDLAVLADNNALAPFAVEPFQTDHVWVIAPREHPLAARLSERMPVPFAEATEYEVVGVHEAGSLDRLLADAAERIGRKLGKRMQVERFSSLVRVVEAGLGIGFLRTTGLHLLAGTDVAAGPLADDWARRSLVIARRADAPIAAPVAAFLALCRRTIERTERATVV